MPLHDLAKVAGVTEACRYNSHDECRNPSCACSCHQSASNPNVPAASSKVEGGPENACPTCGIKRPATESFCRIDGTRLTSLACGMCARGMNPEDKFCFNCGAPKGTIGQAIPKTKVVVTVPEVEAGYEQQVLRGLQEELGEQDKVGQADNRAPQGEGRQEMVVQELVERPGGSQGTFRLVSAPNPNKIRTPVSSNRPSIKLPVKPS